jgi:hypothetical protein
VLGDGQNSQGRGDEAQRQTVFRQPHMVGRAIAAPIEATET